MTPEILDRLTAARDARCLAVLATRLPDGLQVLFRESGGSLQPDGTDPPRARLAAAVIDAALSERSEIVSIDAESWFLHVHAPPPRLLVVGAVHIAQSLAPLARLAGLAVTVIDPRDRFATAERFPGTELVVAWPDEALRALSVDRHSAIVTLTHDPKLDDPALDAALNSRAFYIGALGSRKTQGARWSRLREAGFDEAAIARVRGPVGLAIGAIGAPEIALSIIAEIVAAQRGGTLAARG